MHALKRNTIVRYMNLDLMYCNLPSQPTTRSASQSKCTSSSRLTRLVRLPPPRVKIILNAPQQEQTFPSVPVLPVHHHQIQ